MRGKLSTVHPRLKRQNAAHVAKEVSECEENRQYQRNGNVVTDCEKPESKRTGTIHIIDTSKNSKSHLHNLTKAAKKNIVDVAGCLSGYSST